MDVTFPSTVFFTNFPFSYTTAESTGVNVSKFVSVQSTANPMFPCELFAEPGVIPLMLTDGFVRSIQKFWLSRSAALFPALSV